MAFPHLKNLIDSLTARRLPWAEVSVCVGGAPVWGYAAGYADPENGVPYETGSRAMYYSLTKIVTALAAMKLTERGVLTLDTVLSDVLPVFSALRTPDGKTAKVTVKHLMSMSSGFSYDTKPFVNTRPTVSAREAVRPLASSVLAFTPGEHWLYGFGMDVLGAMMEEITGKKLSALFDETVFAPADIKGIRFLSALNDLSSLPPMFRTAGGSYVSAPLDTSCMPSPLAESAGAGLTGNAEEFARLMSLTAGGGIIKEESFDLMTGDTLTDTSRPDCFWNSLRGYGYALGVRTLIDASASSSPVGECGWGGQAGSYALIDRTRALGLCFLTHVIGQSETDLFRLIREALYADL